MALHTATVDLSDYIEDETTFEGHFDVHPPLDEATQELVNGLNRTRRVKRDLTKLGMSKEEAARFGVEGEFYTADDDGSVLDSNSPPSTQPSLWCQWRYENGHIEWDEGEKFYTCVEWLGYLIDTIFTPRSYVLNGTVTCQMDGEDIARICVVNNRVSTSVIENEEDEDD